jgi:hypothetical protein
VIYAKSRSELAKNLATASKDQHFPNSRIRVTDTFLSYGDLLLTLILNYSEINFAVMDKHFPNNSKLPQI